MIELFDPLSLAIWIRLSLLLIGGGAWVIADHWES